MIMANRSDPDPWDTSGEVHALALVISNTYRARHGMEPLDKHASVDEDIAEAILASGWLRDRDAAKWDEGVNAHSNSSSIFTRDTLEKNPYRENPNPNGVRSGDVVKIDGRGGKWEVGLISLSHEAYLLDVKGTRVTRAPLRELTRSEAK